MMNLIMDSSKNLPHQENIHVKMRFDSTGEMLTCEVDHINNVEAVCGFIQVVQVDPPRQAIPHSLSSSPAAVFSHSRSLRRLKDSAKAPLPAISSTPPLCPAMFRVHKILGVGGMGTVALVAHINTSQYFALKVVKKVDLREHEYPFIFTEQDTMRHLVGSPWFLQLKASFQDKRHFFLLTDFCSEGSLDKKIYKAMPGGLPEPDARGYIVQLVLAIEDLHFRRIIHRDLKPSNILLNAHGHVQVADFGLARQFGPSFNAPWRGDPRWQPRNPSGHSKSSIQRSLRIGSSAQRDYTMSLGGTWAYMSPEAIRRRAVSYPADVWGIGMCLYEMLLGKLPFDIKPESSKRQITCLILSNPVVFDGFVTFHASAKDLIRKLLDKDPSTRITIKQVKAHPWFESVDWDAVTKKCFMRRAVHWYAREGDEPAPSALSVEFGTPYKSAQDVPYPWFQWTQPRALTSPMDEFQETFPPSDTEERQSSLGTHPNPTVEVPNANTSTRCTYNASNRPFLSALCGSSSVTLASNPNETKKSGLATRGNLKAQGSSTRLALSSK
ncbi:transporter [Ganoderma sinense ZZ0214-1]|uniref:non-specific serine/threonine protein kinase n=1 Tax=Ganoderma sinense ZZ0214-1 TaxID=1077348 RepID=A0A2G8SAV7_9APHY|nr:transporter [Ganoderma sinense ZZ0214-1]